MKINCLYADRPCLAGADDLCRVPGNDDAGGDVFHDDCPSPNNCMILDDDTWPHKSVCRHPGMVGNRDRPNQEREAGITMVVGSGAKVSALADDSMGAELDGANAVADDFAGQCRSMVQASGSKGPGSLLRGNSGRPSPRRRRNI